MANRVDANQKKIVTALRQLRAEWIPTSGDPKIGFDGIVCYRGMVYIVEIKDGSLPPSRRVLTEVEAERRRRIEAHGCKYWVIEDVEDVLDMLRI